MSTRCGLEESESETLTIASRDPGCEEPPAKIELNLILAIRLYGVEEGEIAREVNGDIRYSVQG